MSYSGTLYATAGLGQGPTGIAPPWRRRGFHSFQGLGAIDRLAQNRTRTFVFSITAVRGLTSGDAGLVPRRIAEYMRSNGLTNAEAGWAAGGRVWGRFILQVANPLITESAERRAKLVRALQQAAASLGATVSFEVGGYGRIPAGAPASAPASSGGAVTELPAIDIEGTVPQDTVNVRQLQTVVKSKGFNPGTIDGKWGPNTSGALNQAAQEAGRPLRAGEAVGSADKTAVTLPTAVWSAVQALPARTAPVGVTHSAPAITVTDIAPELEEGGLPDWLPWGLGAAALLGVGGYFVWRGRKKRGGARAAVAANRRRRRRTSRRR